jgi:hypothetical protein
MSDIKAGDAVTYVYRDRENPGGVTVKGKVSKVLYEFKPDNSDYMDVPRNVLAIELTKVGGKRRKTLRRKNGTRKN